jgi:hypothetical protein
MSFICWDILKNAVQVCQEAENNAGTGARHCSVFTAVSLAAMREVYHSVTRCCQQSTDANGGHLENL